MMQSAIRVHRIVPTEMRDSNILRADVYRPDDKEKHSAILVRTPYNEQVTGYTDYLHIKGHGIGIDIANSGFPAVDRNMNIGNPLARTPKGSRRCRLYITSRGMLPS